MAQFLQYIIITQNYQLFLTKSGTEPIIYAMAIEISLTADDPGSSYPGYDPDEPTIENEKLAWWLRKQFYGMQQTGFKWQQELMDEAISALSTTINADFSSLLSWIDSCLSNMDLGAPIPTPPEPSGSLNKANLSPSTYSTFLLIQSHYMMLSQIMYQFFTGKWGNKGYIGKGQYDNTVADLYEADVMAVQAWIDAAIAAKLAGNPIPAKPVLSTPDDYKGMLSGNQLILNTQNNIRLRINIGLLDGELKGAVGMDSGDLSELIDKLDEAMMIDGVPILEALAAVGLHITLADGTAHIEYGDEP